MKQRTAQQHLRLLSHHQRAVAEGGPNGIGEGVEGGGGGVGGWINKRGTKGGL